MLPCNRGRLLAEGYTEDALVEQPAIGLFEGLGWKTQNCYYETFGPNGALGRETTSDVVLVRRLRPALESLNKHLPKEAIDQAIDELIRDRSKMSPANANREVYRLLKDGVKVAYRDARGQQVDDRARVIDWKDPLNNDFFLASQFWVSGEMYKRRADLVGFVNGLPLVFVELKAIHKRLESAYEGNLRDYKNSIPQVFWYNGFIILSNGSQSRIGSMTADWQHFAEWKKINSEGEEGIVSLETMIRGTCEQTRLMDIVENFVLFAPAPGSGALVKMLAKNHQYLGVNNAITALGDIEQNRGRLGVFWHTQGSGKSYSMVFFGQKILRKLGGNYTFVVVTDRDELDTQIYKNFVGSGVVTEEEAQAGSGRELRQLLAEDHRYVFTLIQKFRTDRGERHPVLSNRSDVIVVADEAHRSQYDTFALNMRNALPNAAFIAFTGTPLIAGEEKTKDVFGDYVSVYDFKQSVDDNATVPLFYENRIPELQLTNRQLNEDMQRIIDEAELDEGQEAKLAREFAREYQLITRDERLDKIAEDIVSHFMGRGYMGKAMVVSIDKATAVRMYDKVRKGWAGFLEKLRANLSETSGDEARWKEMKDQIAYMESTDMGVVVSQAQNEAEDLAGKGADIVPHRRRMLKEDLGTKFKDPDDPFRIVFVCAMWMTGFDVPCCSTIYLDKPMRNHTLMQTIARANRVFKEKNNGVIVDYVGVFRNLQKALAIYGSGVGGGIGKGESPVQEKFALVARLRKAVEVATEFCNGHKVDLAAILLSEGLNRVKLIDDAVDAILITDESKQKYKLLAADASGLYKAILPDSSASEFRPVCTLLHVVSEKIRSLAGPVDISGVMYEVEQILDHSVAAEGYVIDPAGAATCYDLSKIDFEAIKKQFCKSRKRTEIEKLRGAIAARLSALVRHNRMRMNYLEKFQQMIDEYNAGSANVDEFFKQLVDFARNLNDEEKRGIAENLTEEELAVFDLLTRPEMKLTAKELKEVKKVAHELLDVLKREKLVLDWRKKQQAREGVRLSIREALDTLPQVYSKDVYDAKCDLVYQHVFDSYFDDGRSVYTLVA
jgi:type I restriction enzyme R subunit